MESKERIKEWAEGLEELKESVGNEESTKRDIMCLTQKSLYQNTPQM